MLLHILKTRIRQLGGLRLVREYARLGVLLPMVKAMARNPLSRQSYKDAYAVTLAAGISFVDDIHSLPDSVRLVVQFVAMGLLFLQIVQSLGIAGEEFAWWVWALIGIAALIVCVGATNIYNFMDGINGITAGYSLAVLVPLLLKNGQDAFVNQDLIVVTILSVT